MIQRKREEEVSERLMGGPKDDRCDNKKRVRAVPCSPHPWASEREQKEERGRRKGKGD
jgi:hypothetical protein